MVSTGKQERGSNGTAIVVEMSSEEALMIQRSKLVLLTL
jgi:hypothetical protein